MHKALVNPAARVPSAWRMQRQGNRWEFGLHAKLRNTSVASTAAINTPIFAVSCTIYLELCEPSERQATGAWYFSNADLNDALHQLAQISNQTNPFGDAMRASRCDWGPTTVAIDLRGPVSVKGSY